MAYSIVTYDPDKMLAFLTDNDRNILHVGFEGCIDGWNDLRLLTTDLWNTKAVNINTTDGRSQPLLLSAHGRSFQL